MSRNSQVDEIRKLFASSLEKDEVSFMYLGYSGVIVRTYNRCIIIDPAGLLNDEEITALEGVDLLLFTHSHGDHYRSGVALNIFKATGATILAEPLVANDLEGIIPSNKLTSINPGEKFSFDEITVRTIKGIHRGPINLYHIKIGDLTLFHGGDSGYVPVKDYPADLAFLPTGSPSPTASPEYAFKMISDLKPSVVVAIHGSSSQNSELEDKVKENMPRVIVIVPEPHKQKVVSLKK